MYSPEEIAEITVATSEKKLQKSLLERLILGFIGGAMVSLGYLAYVRVTAGMAPEVGGLATFLGASVFPIGLIVILLAGGELITGNMMVVSFGFLAKKASLGDLLKNWIVITLANLVGALFVAYFFGHVVGLTGSGIYLEQTVNVAQGKIAASAGQAFISGMGCNWFVGLALWLTYGAKEAAGKFLGAWFPIMAFVAIGFQHSVANMFIIPAAIFEGQVTWLEFLQNVIPVYLGNIVGACVFISLFYYLAYYRKNTNK